MKKDDHLNRLITAGEYRFSTLIVGGIDNEPVLKRNSPRMADEEICLFHRDVSTGEDYFNLLHGSVLEGLEARKMFPVVRFADGEYAFYGCSLRCNGLYRQAESVRAIRKALPFHVEALGRLTQTGRIAALIFPGNVEEEKRSFLSAFRRSRKSVSSLEFVEFLHHHGIKFDRDNYVPFYVVYAYLTSREFITLADRKKICIISSEYHEKACQEWFERAGSRPLISFAQIPGACVATQWPFMKEKVLGSIPQDTDLCLVGAGVGALPICVDAAERLSIPAIDAGHVLNMMNGREDKSKGPRLYTLWTREI